MPRQASTPPDLTTQAGRLRWAREKAHFTSMRSAAQAHRWNENTYKAHELGIRQGDGLKTRTAEKYAKAFGVTAQWLLLGTGDPIPAPAAPMSPEEDAAARAYIEGLRDGKKGKR